jgi:hypothetical protein
MHQVSLAIRAGDDAGGLLAWRMHWHPPLLAVLCGNGPAAEEAAEGAVQAATGQLPAAEDRTAVDSQLRANASVYALPTALRLDPDSLPLLLRELLSLQLSQVPFATIWRLLCHMPVGANNL